MSNLGYKDLPTLRSLLIKPWHPKLIDLLTWLVVRHNGDHILFTSGYREGDPGVHGQDPLRGFDLRSSLFEDPLGVVEDINKFWTYDEDRPQLKVAILHDVGQGVHLHLQVCNKTRYLTINT